MFRVSLKMFLLRNLLAADIGLEVEFALRFVLLIQIWTTRVPYDIVKRAVTCEPRGLRIPGP
jgi:hypothetical protein